MYFLERKLSAGIKNCQVGVLAYIIMNLASRYVVISFEII
jgi:hypothetical protein